MVDKNGEDTRGGSKLGAKWVPMTWETLRLFLTKPTKRIGSIYVVEDPRKPVIKRKKVE